MEINVLIDGEFEKPPEADWLQSIAQQVLEAEDAGTSAELGLVITGPQRIRELNKQYRGIDEPTDVLAFYMLPVTEDNRSGGPAFITAPDGLIHLGEVIISYPQAAIQAEEHHHSIAREMVILIIHGVLHLLGYDHETPAEQRQMSAREAELLTQIRGLS